MTSRKFILGILLIGFGIIDKEVTAQECDFSGIDLDREVENIVKMLPKTYRVDPTDEFSPLFAGVDVGAVFLTGMDEIAHYGPVVPFCRKGIALVQVDLVNLGAVKFSSPWRTCSGLTGNVSLRAEYSRVTVHLVVRSRGTGEKYLEVPHEYPIMPVDTYGAEIIVEGLGEGGIYASSVLSKLFPSLPLKMWMHNSMLIFGMVLRDAQKDRNEVL
uniref:Putative secreted protein n=1 Tax=Amblyomma triste TaxID=251400 RepID=A0A023GAW6_AMBTT